MNENFEREEVLRADPHQPLPIIWLLAYFGNVGYWTARLYIREWFVGTVDG